VAYATVAELAAALRITVTTDNTATLQACLDAATLEIDTAMDRFDVVTPMSGTPEQEALANRVNVLRGVEWFKSNDAAFGVVGFADTGVLQAPKNTFARHAAALVPLKQQWGVA
jgi:hypothetical protein